MQPSNETTNAQVIQLATAYMGNHSVPVDQIGTVLQSIRLGIVNLGAPAVVEAAPLVPAVSVKKSVTADYIICLEDGKKLKSLKRHLRSFDLTPDQYRAKWSLPTDYPMVAPNYAAKRSELAKAAGLGRKAKTEAPVKAIRAPRAKKVKEAPVEAVEATVAE